MSLLAISNETGVRLPPNARTQMEAAAAAALGVGGGPAVGDSRIEVTIVSDDRLRELSREYLGVDHYTDVMSFSQLDAAGDDVEPVVRGGPRRQLLGDVVISRERARDQALEWGHPIQAELALLVAHGVLHLLGYADDTPESGARMRRLEEQAMTAAGIRANISRGPG